VINTRSLGYGRYSFELGSPASDFDPNVVLGLLTWSDDPAYANREIDYEFSRWADARNRKNGQYVVMPHRWNRQRFRQPAVASSTQSFDWRQNAVTFTSSSAVPSRQRRRHDLDRSLRERDASRDRPPASETEAATRRNSDRRRQTRKWSICSDSAAAGDPRKPARPPLDQEVGVRIPAEEGRPR
jgi:hypothetical protein